MASLGTALMTFLQIQAVLRMCYLVERLESKRSLCYPTEEHSFFNFLVYMCFCNIKHKRCHPDSSGYSEVTPLGTMAKSSFKNGFELAFKKDCSSHSF